MANTSKNYIDKKITSFFKQRKLMVNQIDSSKNYKITSNGYNKISTINNSNTLVDKLNSLPEVVRSLFKIYNLNYMQDRCFGKLYKKRTIQ